MGGVALSRSLCISGLGNGGDDAGLYFQHLLFHAVFEDRHVVDEVLAGGRTVEEVLRESCVLRGGSFFVQELAQVNRHLFLLGVCLDAAAGFREGVGDFLW